MTTRDIVISGLGDFSAPSLGAFDLELSYDSAVLLASAVTFGSFLDVGSLESSRSFDLSTLGVISLTEISFESAVDLIANQPASFTLATLEFIGVAAGTSAIQFNRVDLSDEEGLSLVDAGTTAGSVTVRTPGTSVPDP